uniref:DNA-directed RNA polymerase subunit beta'' n=1 Tax=Nephroselmis astigmatica TaxID=259378 RepID=A0A088CII6_9CHLO|nr:beta'' subunit of RNA polymerase [Nephroselmis astigmatica]AID67725.1 beta'' subunit of RNA polymerase [Nephroselmis astigmatica]
MSDLDTERQKNYEVSQERRQIFLKFKKELKRLAQYETFYGTFVIKKKHFWNRTFDKGGLKRLISWFIIEQGSNITLELLEILKTSGFHAATRAGISISIEDLRIPPTKQTLLEKAEQEIYLTDWLYQEGKITAVERFQKVIDTWNGVNERLKDQVVQHFLETDILNPVYMMAFSGARGNISQVRQLVGMRGLMADPQGRIIDLPIRSNFREGLTVTEYVISCYGARKGLVDTALRTANSGYLTRRLVDVAQDVMIRRYNCGNSQGIIVSPLYDRSQKLLVSLPDRVLGRVLTEFSNIPGAHYPIPKFDLMVDLKIAGLLEGCDEIMVRSPLTCVLNRDICQLCYGWSLGKGSLGGVGEAVGVIAAQSIGEPGTQLTMRTFHTGGVFSGGVADQLCAPCKGKIRYPKPIGGRMMRTRHGEIAFCTMKPGTLVIKSPTGQETEFSLPKYSILLATQGEWVEKDQLLAEFASPFADPTEEKIKPVLTPRTGQVYCVNVVVRFEQDEKSDRIALVVKRHGSLWILYGKLRTLPIPSKLWVQRGDFLAPYATWNRFSMASPYQGIVNSTQSELETCILISLGEWNVDRGYYKNTNHLEYQFRSSPDHTFVWYKGLEGIIKPNKTIGLNQLDGYQTLQEIVLLTDAELPNKQLFGIDQKTYWLYSPDSWQLKVEPNSYVYEGQVLAEKDQGRCQLISPNTGWIQIMHRRNFQMKRTGYQIILKPGWVYPVSDLARWPHGVIYGGTLLPNGVSFSYPIYLEWLNLSTKNQEFSDMILIRQIHSYPLVEYCGSDHPMRSLTKILNQDCCNWKNPYQTFRSRDLPTRGFDIEIIPNFPYQNGQIVQEGQSFVEFQVSFVDPLNTLQIEPQSQLIPPDQPGLSAKMRFYQNGYVRLAPRVTMEHNTKLLMQPKSPFLVGTPMAEHWSCYQEQGEFHANKKGPYGVEKTLLLGQEDIIVCQINKALPYVSLGDFIQQGQEIADRILSPHAGQVIEIRETQIILRGANPYRISVGSELEVSHNYLVEEGQRLVSLLYRQPKTGDIVQGLPRVEEILEARKTKDLKEIKNHPNRQLEFRFHQNQKEYSRLAALYISLEEIQLLIIRSIQRVYQSQGVQISDKHIEIIVRKMTSKVLILDGGDASFLPGELVDRQLVEFVNQLVRKPATFKPIIMGITKAALMTDSFISAASFQETTRVLTEAAIQGKKDWLRGLKENVVLGKLIPAGTGFCVPARKPELYARTTYQKITLRIRKKIRYKKIREELVKQAAEKNLLLYLKEDSELIHNKQILKNGLENFINSEARR